jgi:hypothetical protein
MVSLSEPAKSAAVAGSFNQISSVASMAGETVSLWQAAQSGTLTCGVDPADIKLVTSLSVTLTMGLRDNNVAGGICATVGSDASAILQALLPTGDTSSVSGRMGANLHFLSPEAAT